MTTHLSFDIQLSERRSAAEREQVLASPGFGQVFTDHMITIDWTEGDGWHDARLEPYGPLDLDPATAVFHYAQEFFEGLKAYRQANGSIVTFRPYANAARFNSSRARMAMPELPEETFVRALELLVAHRPRLGADHRGAQPLPAAVHDRDPARPRREPARRASTCSWSSPRRRRPTSRRRQAGLGLAVAGVHPRRARRHRRGQVRRQLRGGLRGPARRPSSEGCDQVVWLDAAEHRWVEEMGGMNLFFVYGGRDACVDAGAHRHAAARHHPRLAAQARRRPGLPGGGGPHLHRRVAGGLRVRRADRGLRLRHRRRHHPGRLGQGRRRRVAGRRRHAGPVTMRLREELVGIQYGSRPDPHGWIHKIC